MARQRSDCEQMEMNAEDQSCRLDPDDILAHRYL